MIFLNFAPFKIILILALNFFILPPLKKRITGFASNTLRFVGWFATE